MSVTLSVTRSCVLFTHLRTAFSHTDLPRVNCHFNHVTMNLWCWLLSHIRICLTTGVPMQFHAKQSILWARQGLSVRRRCDGTHEDFVKDLVRFLLVLLKGPRLWLWSFVPWSVIVRFGVLGFPPIIAFSMGKVNGAIDIRFVGKCWIYDPVRMKTPYSPTSNLVKRVENACSQRCSPKYTRNWRKECRKPLRWLDRDLPTVRVGFSMKKSMKTGKEVVEKR